MSSNSSECAILTESIFSVIDVGTRVLSLPTSLRIGMAWLGLASVCGIFCRACRDNDALTSLHIIMPTHTKVGKPGILSSNTKLRFGQQQQHVACCLYVLT